MAISHILSTGIVFLGSLFTPDDFSFDDIASEPARTDGGEES
ncbi:hypothetical protein MBEHAL_0599 [Halarchaeum acidiphilum MH1-52-1]|uniref:Uncharacterized protein n=1 Tax=Halarchaeum acidiphilum MH1-52-1 TaxID=1261545 RepID=U3A2H9_9EURY|nr:hypothetical protein [Halarchaeum acidiphilum]GAD51839.1 hypothetical protein MBEHAL_0599 [Halarchaeum acidiphilum MH1-52-1]